MGSYFGLTGLAPPTHSWANDVANDVGVLHLTLQPGAVIEIPPAVGGISTARSLYVLEGSGVTVNERPVARPQGHGQAALVVNIRISLIVLVIINSKK